MSRLLAWDRLSWQQPRSTFCASAAGVIELNGVMSAIVLYVLALVAVVIGVDVLFLRNRFWEQLIVNVGIVLVFAAFYLTVPQALMRVCTAHAPL